MLDHSANVLVTVVLGVLCLPADAEDVDRAESVPGWAVDMLMRQGLSTDPDPLCDWIESRLPDRETRVRIERLIDQLNAPEFEDREQATRELARAGRFFRARLQSLAKSDDPEVASRVRRILKQIEGGGDPSATTLLAVLRVLRSKPTPRAVAPLLEAMPYFPSGDEREVAAEVVWRSAGRDALPAIRAATQSADPTTRAVALVALEAVLDDAAVETIEPFLASDDPILRVAAGRALIEHRPGPAWRGVLVGLKQPRDGVAHRMARVAAAVLSGHRDPSDVPATLDSASLPKGGDRWCNSLSETAHLEDFGSKDSVVVNDRFRGWRLDSMAPEKPIVEAGELRFPSPGNEGDVRLVLSLEELLPAGTDEWRLAVDVRSDGNNPVAWHPGISLGEVKILFHPGFSSGAFRIETRAGHRAIVPNQSMGYTPRTGVFHRLVVDVRTNEKGRTANITITDLGRPEDTFTYEYPLPDNRIPHVGLERSGRSGGVATFRRFELVVPRKLR